MKMMIPSDSDYTPQLSPSVSENIDSLARMLLGTSMSYEKETCRLLLEKIKEKITLTPQLQDSLKKLEEMVKNPSSLEPFAVQQVLTTLQGTI